MLGTNFFIISFEFDKEIIIIIIIIINMYECSVHVCLCVAYSKVKILRIMLWICILFKYCLPIWPMWTRLHK